MWSSIVLSFKSQGRQRPFRIGYRIDRKAGLCSCPRHVRSGCHHFLLNPESDADDKRYRAWRPPSSAHCCRYIRSRSGVLAQRGISAPRAAVNRKAGCDEGLVRKAHRDSTGRILHIRCRGQCPAMEQEFPGYPAAERFETGIFTTVGQESLEIARQVMKDAFDSGSGETEAWLLGKNGAKVCCYLTGVRIIFE